MNEQNSSAALRIGGVTLLMGAFAAVIWIILSKSHKAKQGR